VSGFREHLKYSFDRGRHGGNGAYDAALCVRWISGAKRLGRHDRRLSETGIVGGALDS
jgi:hypothetical protein